MKKLESLRDVLSSDRFRVTLPDTKLSERVVSFHAGLLSTRFELGVLECDDGETAKLILGLTDKDISVKVEVLSSRGEVVYTPVDSTLRIEDVFVTLDCTKVKPLIYTVILRGVAKSS